MGKVPDPKSQVEQITIALIYKFMDDMDKESLAFGGKAAFFKGEYEKYTWSRIFDPKLGGFDLITLYSEAITTMRDSSGHHAISLILLFLLLTLRRMKPFLTLPAGLLVS